jgi:DNA-binding beta-propeller fold protein YncE
MAARLLASTAAAAAVLAVPGSSAAACIPARQVFAVREAAKVSFRQPSDLVLAGERLLVLDDLNGRVALLDLAGRSLGAIALPGSGEGSWLGLGFGGADQVFLGASEAGTVVVLDLKGRQVREFPVWAAGESRPTGILVSRGSCFVADTANHRVRVFSLDGREQVSWGGLGEGPAQFRGPFRIAQDSLDRVLVSDALNSRILVFTPRGDPLAAFGEFGTTEGTLFRPAGLAVLGGDRVLVADNYFGSLQVFDSRGAYQGVLCGSDGRPLALENPTGVAARGGTVYVVEMGAGRVSAWEIGGR